MSLQDIIDPWVFIYLNALVAALVIASDRKWKWYQYPTCFVFPLILIWAYTIDELRGKNDKPRNESGG